MAALTTQCAHSLRAAALPETTVPAADLELLVTGAGRALAPVCAVVGGLVAQEVLKAVSGRDVPWRNVVTFHALAGEAVVLDVS